MDLRRVWIRPGRRLEEHCLSHGVSEQGHAAMLPQPAKKGGITEALCAINCPVPPTFRRSQRTLGAAVREEARRLHMTTGDHHPRSSSRRDR